MFGKILASGVMQLVFLFLVVDNAAILSREGTPRLLKIISETDAPLWQTCTEGDGSYPNFQNCSSFFICANGMSYLMECPAGLVWNIDGGYCDWPYNTECIQNKLPIPIAAGP